MAAVVADRRALREATRADLEPVVLAHDGTPGAAAALARRAVAERTPVADLTDEAGVRHRLWRVSDPGEVAMVRADLARRRAVIADGHHRWAAASGSADGAAERPGVGAAAHPAGRAADHRAAAEGRAAGAAHSAARAADARPAAARRAADAAHPVAQPGEHPPAAAGAGDEAGGPRAAVRGRPDAAWDDRPTHRTLALVVPAGEHGPQVRAIHRVLPNTALDGIDARRFRCDPLDPLGTAEAEVLLATASRPLVLVTDGDRWLRLTAPDASAVPPGWRELDVALVDVLLVADPATVVLRHSVAAAVAEARATRGVALLVRPTPTATVLELAARGVLMPRKSTFFVPKPRTGLVLRCFADQP